MAIAYRYEEDDDKQLRDAGAPLADHGESAGGAPAPGGHAAHSLAEINAQYGGAGEIAVAGGTDLDQLSLHGAAPEPSHVDPVATAIAQTELERPAAAAHGDHAQDADAGDAGGLETGAVQHAPGGARQGPAHDVPSPSALSGAAQGLQAIAAAPPAPGAAQGRKPPLSQAEMRDMLEDSPAPAAAPGGNAHPLSQAELHEFLDDPAPAAAPRAPAAAPGNAHPLTQAELHEFLDDPAPAAAPKAPAAAPGNAHPLSQAELHEFLDDPAPTAAPKAPGGAPKAATAATSWQGTARAYNQRHGLVAQFNAATHNACGSGGDADPDAIAAWQKAHGIPADGRIGPVTLGAATRVAAAPARADAPAPAAAPKPAIAPTLASAPAPAAAPKPAIAPTLASAPAVVPAPRTVKPVPAAAPAPVVTPAPQVVKPVPVAAAVQPAEPAVTAPRPAATPSATADSFIGTDDLKKPGKDRWTSYGKGDNKTYGWDLGGTHGVKNPGGAAGKIDQGEAVKSLIAYDEKLNGGKPSVEGLVLLPVLLADLVKATMARSAAAPAPTARPAAPRPTAPVAHEVAAPNKPAPLAPVAHDTKPTVTPVANGPAPAAGHIPGVTDAAPHAGNEAFHTIVNPGPELPSVYVCVPPGGVTGSVEVFLFLHGMYAHEAPRKDMPIKDPNPEEAMNLAGAMARTQRNLVTLAPIAQMVADYPQWKKLEAKHDGYTRLIQGAIAALPAQAHHGDLSVGSISIAGHSAGGQALGEAADQLGDMIHDMTMEDGGYGDNQNKYPGSHAWSDAHAKVVKWLLTGNTEKLLRVLLHGEDNHGEGHVLDSNLNAQSLTEAANKMGLTTVQVTKEVFARHDKRSVDTMHLAHKLHITGLPAPRTVSVFNMPGSLHMQVRDLSTQALIEEGRDTEFQAAGAAPSVGTQVAAPQHGHKPTRPHAEPAPAPTTDPTHHAAQDQAPKITPVVAPPVPVPADHDGKPAGQTAKPDKPADHADKAKHGQAKHAKADAGPQPGDIVVADLADLDALIADVHDPRVKAAAQAVHAVSDKSKELTSTALDRHELKGPGRVELVKLIRTTHDQIAGLAADIDAAKLAAIKSRMFRALQEVSPYHEQARNIDILENNAEMAARGKTGDTTRTCNITSLAMALEGLGRSAGDFKGSQDKLLAAARHFKVGDVNIAAHGDLQAAGGGGSDWKTMLALRLPDFLELAAIAHFMTGTDDASVLAGADKAWGGIKLIDTLATLAREFDVNAEVKYFSFDPTAAATGKGKHGTNEQNDTKESGALDGRSKDQRHKVDDLIDLHNKIDLETDAAKKAALQKQYDQKKAGLGSAMTDKQTGIELQKYKQAVIDTIGAELAAGKAVETHVIQHFVRVRAIHDEFVVIDDPARQARAHKNVRWEEARAEGLFAKRLVLT